MHSRYVLLGGLVAAALITSPASTANANPPTGDEAQTKPNGLTIAILDMAEAPDLTPQAPAEARRPAWRTSFGSERLTEPEIKVAATSGPLQALDGVDAVLIQGVKAAAPLRRMFPPSAWRLIVSRRLIVPVEPGFYRTSQTELPPATAIAVRARPGLRITGRAHARRQTETNPHAPAATLPAASTAVRVVSSGKPVWLASVTIPPTCGAVDSACPARDGLEAWRAARRNDGEATLVGGRLVSKSEKATGQDDAGPCAMHGIESDLATHAAPAAGDKSGCLSIVRLDE